MARTTRLSWFFDSEFGDEDVRRLAEVVADLGRDSGWPLGAPTIVDEIDSAGVRSVGGTVLLHDATVGDLDAEIDRDDLEAVTGIIRAIQPLTVGTDPVAFVIELDGDQVGWVENGGPDPSLREGLLEPWEARFRDDL